ncbi:MAG: phosphatidylglycerol:prolipoprotein diacylglycerol transferase [Candidatus Tokpelaia sp. JSC161]|jgi:phosphatidylglycerol:prolipoprotein diacylglycerol transferase|nr:MAG: phosphatidylglycerol:prolipoprotein diacylglycerol transferase [Candidatus Tokpelaia sp. JSC161]
MYTALPFPNINPILLRIGPFKLHWYGLCYVLGILFASLYGKHLLKKHSLWKHNSAPMQPEKLDDFIIWATISIILGGRLGEIIFYNPSYYFSNPKQMIAVWNGGMSFHGGFLATSIAMLLFAKKNKISIWGIFDTVAAGVPIGLGLVRICNFINSELFGRITTIPWAVYFPNGGLDETGKLVGRHPSQIYEAILEGFVLFLLLFFLIFYLKALKKPGLVSGSFILAYGVFRFFVEFFREPTISYVAGHWLTMGMFLSGPMIIIGQAIVIRAITQNK